MDFDALNRQLLFNVKILIPSWLPEARKVGKNYVCGSLLGNKGKSLSINTETGVWKDFATGECGGDLVSLYAAKNCITQGQAYRELTRTSGHRGRRNRKILSTMKAKATHSPQSTLVKPPPNTPYPYQTRYAKEVYEYCNRNAELIFLVARYVFKDGKSLPSYSWDKNLGWVGQAWPIPRPLYRLQYLKIGKPILVVEGEKAANAAACFASRYFNIVSWSGGTESVLQADWSPVYGYEIWIWPDSDKKKAASENEALKYSINVGQEIPYRHQTGIKCAYKLANFLYPNVKNIKILNVEGIGGEGWDAADSNFDERSFLKFVGLKS